MFAEPQGTRVGRSGSDAGSDPGPSYLASSDQQQRQQQQQQGVAAPAAVVGLHVIMSTPQGAGTPGLQLLSSPTQDTTTTIQLHSPMTGESRVVGLGAGSFGGLGAEASPGSQELGTVGTVAGPSPHSSPLRPDMGGLLDSADLAAVQHSLASMSLHQVWCRFVSGESLYLAWNAAGQYFSSLLACSVLRPWAAAAGATSLALAPLCCCPPTSLACISTLTPAGKWRRRQQPAQPAPVAAVGGRRRGHVGRSSRRPAALCSSNSSMSLPSLCGSRGWCLLLAP